MKAKLIVSTLVLVAGLLITSLAPAQVAISEEGVTFPDDATQTSAVILPIDCPHGDAIVWDTNAANWVCATDLSPVICPCAVGEAGPAGGIIFYVTADGLHGLEAAPEDQGVAEWGCYQSPISGADDIAVGTGEQNTADILRPSEEGGCEDRPIAASVADDYQGPTGDTAGWFLPSKDELNLMYENLYIQIPPLGGFADDFYWSSSEANDGKAWTQLFLVGSQGLWNKNDPRRVRAARAF